MALIGETGSGKSSLALAAAGLLPRSATITGQVTIAGRDVAGMNRADFRRVRASLLGCIAQDAMAALNPVVPVGRQIGELFAQHAGMSRQQAAEAAIAALAQVEIRQPAAVARLYPHQLSGGMRQRVMIAMAVALAPPLIVADEPTTALDVSTQAEILALIGELREGMRSGFLWITHDMGVVAELADWAAVMYAGRIVEQAPVEQIFDAPAHPYTQGLLRTRQDLRAGAAGTPLFQIPGCAAGARARSRLAARSRRGARAPRRCAPTSIRSLEPVSAAHLAACHHPATPDPAAEMPQSAGSCRSRRRRGKAMIGFEGVSKQYRGGRLALDDVTLRRAGRREPRPGRRVRVGQDDLHQARPRARRGPHRGGSPSTAPPYPSGRGKLRVLRRQIGFVLQDPYDSLDPRMTIRDIVTEPLRIHGLPGGRGPGGDALVTEQLSAVGLPGAELRSYPARYSGGGTAADRDRQGPDHRPVGADLRRADVEPRRVRAVPDREPAAGRGSCAAPVDALRDPRPGLDRPRRRYSRRDVRRPDRRDRSCRADPPFAPASLHQGPA